MQKRGHGSQAIAGRGGNVGRTSGSVPDMLSAKLCSSLLPALVFTLAAKPTPPDALPAAAAVELSVGASTPALTATAKELDAKLAAIPPLSRKQLFALAPKVLAATKVVEPETYVLSASQPVHARAVLHVVAGSALASPDGYGRATFRGSTETEQSSYFEVEFPTRAGRGYLIDCAVAGASAYFVMGGGAGFRTVPLPSGGHLTFALRRQEGDGSSRLMVAGNAPFGLSHCEVVPVR